MQVFLLSAMYIYRCKTLSELKCYCLFIIALFVPSGLIHINVLAQTVNQSALEYGKPFMPDVRKNAFNVLKH